MGGDFSCHSIPQNVYLGNGQIEFDNPMADSVDVERFRFAATNSVDSDVLLCEFCFKRSG